MSYAYTYWNGKGKHQIAAEKLAKKIPLYGEVENAKKNPALERFRKLRNVYYDFYNNGCGNRWREFRGYVKVGHKQLGASEKLEQALDAAIIAACIEQGIYHFSMGDE